MRFGSLALTLGAAAAGGLLLEAADLPAGLLIGATLGAAAMAVAGRGAAVPDRLRDAGFAMIGLSLGSSLERETLSSAGDWPLSLAGMVVALIVTWAICTAILSRLFGLGRTTALLATSPGALSYALAVAEPRPDVDLRVVTLVQSVRLLTVTVAIAPMLGGIGSAAITTDVPRMGTPSSILLLVAALVLTRPLASMRIPAPALLSGVAVAAASHLPGFVRGAMDPHLVAIGFVLTGAVIGLRLRGTGTDDLRRLGPAAVMAAATAIATTGLIALLAAPALELHWTQLWLAWAPGGVEAMTALALSSGIDPAFVASHHVARLLLLFVVMPWLLGSARDRSP